VRRALAFGLLALGVLLLAAPAVAQTTSAPTTAEPTSTTTTARPPPATGRAARDGLPTLGEGFPWITTGVVILVAGLIGARLRRTSRG
jgi:hypothetical protein